MWEVWRELTSHKKAQLRPSGGGNNIAPVGQQQFLGQESKDCHSFFETTTTTTQGVNSNCRGLQKPQQLVQQNETS
eukprot:GSA25T00019130001.1